MRCAAIVFSTVLLCSSTLLPVFAQDSPPAANDKKPDEKEKPLDLKPLPPDAHAEQTVTLNGRTLHYTATVGTFPIDKQGKKVAEVVYTSYIAEGNDRPVTFALNGGPGAASVYLNLGAIGPKHVRFGNEGDSPSDPATLTDNPNSWLDFTDLVFIDPVGTGYSRPLVPDEQAKKLFYTTQPDIEYLSRIIFDWLVKNGRMQSRKYLIGESYGGFRGPRITHYLQTQLGVAMNGVVLVSPYLNPDIDSLRDLSPLPWMQTLPSITAAHFEREHKLSPETMQPVIEYTRSQYAEDLLKGTRDQAAMNRLVDKVTELTGLDRIFVLRSGGRLETQAYLREVFRSEGRLGSRYDPNVTSLDPFPFDPVQRSNDPILESIIAPTTTAMVDFDTRILGWKTEARFNALSSEVGRLWVDDDELRNGSVEQLRESVANDPKLRVLIVHGWNDLSCPFMGSVLTVDQMPAMKDPTRVQVHEYPGGHMFYTRADSGTALKHDAEEMYRLH